MQSAGVEYETSQPRRTECVLVANHQVHVIVMLLETCRRQRRLLNECVVGGVIVDGRTQKPLRLLRLRPVKARSSQVIAKGHGNVGWDWNRRDAVDQSQRSQRRERVELSL